MANYLNNVLLVTTSIGTGSLSTSAVPVVGHAAPAAGDDAKLFFIMIKAVDANGVPTGDWELTESVYTHVGTSWSRGSLIGSSTGARIDFAAGNKRIAIVESAGAMVNTKRGTIGGTFEAGGAVLTANAWFRVIASSSGTIVGMTMIADVAGSAVVDIRKSDFAGYPTVSSICAGAKPTLTNAIKTADTALSGWTLTVVKGDCLDFLLETVATVKFLGIELEIIKI